MKAVFPRLALLYIEARTCFAEQKMPVSRDKCFFQVDVESLLTRRQKEYEALLREKECTGTLIKMINKIHEKIKEKYKANIQAMRLNELVRTKRWTKDEAENKKVVQVMHFNLSSDIALMADRMHEHKESSVLLKFWVEASEKSYHDELTLEDLQDSIWDVCWNNYENLCHKIAKGTVTFQEVDRMFLELSQCPADIKTEMDIMSKGTTDKGWTEKRWKQIKEYYDLHLAAESAEVIQDIVKKLELRGDFTTIQNMTKINKPSFKEKTLDYIDRSLLQTKQRLVKMNPECRKCLEEFIRCQEFIKWVKEALINLKEVKVFVDLASISAGENDMEIDRVACFHDAVMGYSPFIYDLQPDTDLNQLIGCAEKVWKALKNDQGLTVKLGDSARYLEWLKTLKESHGSVETSSLSLAAAINSKGVYTVGNNGRFASPNILILRLSLYDENTKEAREYTLEELQELLNKLMLMSGKRARGKEEVATFMENFSNVQRLGKAFIELYSSGNMLYRNWKAFVHCDAKSEVCITMDFSAENIGLLTVDGNLSEQLEILCRAMELCLENWYKFMKETRARFYNLNYYTAEQIVYLCTELGALSARKPLPEQVMVMLSFVKPDCTVEDVRWATPQSMVQNETARHSRRRNVQLPVTGHVFPSKCLSEKIAAIWETFMNDMTVFLAGNLDVTNLGELLNDLSGLNKISVTRHLPPSLYQGRPNLVVCAEPEVFRSALCLYTQSPKQPLPTYDEVLVCSEKTTYEEAELFLRRALSRGSCDQKIYTLIHADRLTYDASVRFGDLFEELKHQSNCEYQFVVICDAKRQHCYIPSYFSCYKVHIGLNVKPEDIQMYLQYHFTVPKERDSAARVFHDRLSVRIVSSTRPGSYEPFTDVKLGTLKLRLTIVPSLSFHFSQANLGLLGILPTVHCRTPREVRVLELRKRRHELPNSLDPLMDRKEFHSEAIQRPYQYLRRFSKGSNLDEFTHRKGSIEEDPVECLVLFLQYCGLRDPSWAELRNFSWFLNLQLKSCESSMFCNPTFVGDTLVGFKLFIVEFMIVMARDFATPSMSISDESLVLSNLCEDEDLLPYILRKRWETQSHPYIFFNADGFSMTFLGFHLRKNRGGDFNAVDHHTGEVLRGNVMSSQLHHGLTLQTIQFNEDFDGLSREAKIRKLSLVLGVTDATDPDTTYELTADNMMKMLAIHMRFRCGIPVIIMGETGCGKTRLIKFLCDLQKGKRETENMKLVKVHGGTTAQAIYAKIQEAEKMAILNKERHNLETILFFDEANTTEAIYAIKEVLCDKTIQGRAMKCHTGLKIIAACNPYRKHSEIMIKRLEMAGLGYRVKAEETDDKLGKVPLRQLVYRVQPLPPSMIPLVWDFGQLSDLAEVAYTKQIVQRYIQNHHLPFSCTQDIVKVLAVSQMFMRQKKDECSFVSLRDVERCMKVLVWFYEQRELLFKYPSPNINLLQALMLTVGVCYYPSLVHKGKYLEAICHYFPEPYNSPAAILKEIVSCQDRFLRDIKMRETIAKNEALKENVFLMVICIELRIPLFLVGKPGSSKSLAKTVVLDAMQGQAAHCDLFKHLKQVHMVSFQCSPHSTPEGIINTFKQCARFQQAKNLQEYVSVVVLDEIGLAEDSPQMPLKTLHPLLEDGCVDDDPSPHKKVGFIGISNWALDPAKMNRGIFVSRLDPCEKELIETAKGICSSGQAVLLKVQDLFPSFAKSYLEICSKQSGQFFGLRDYYSLVKMVFATAKESKCEPTDDQLAEAVLRNFSGKDQFSALDVFLPSMTRVSETSTLQMVNKNIRADGDCRYLLLLTKNYVALQLVQQHIFQELGVTPEIIFGSSFPKDQEYTQICRNVNRVKTCMETGSIVILLNLKNLYESLYDALNQYYVYLGEYQYVDLGLGTHRVKCRVDKKFRLIVVEDKDIVYEQFPIPLINRLEKHSLDMSTVLSLQQRTIVEQLEAWVKEFVAVKARFASEAKLSLTPSEVIIGFHSDACASVLLQVLDTAHMANEEICDTRSVFNSAKHLLLNCVTPDAVVRLKSSKLGDHEAKELWAEYFVKQRHRSLSDYIQQHLKHTETRQRRFVEVTTFSRLLTQSDIKVLIKELHVDPGWFRLLFLHQFDTEHSFCKEIRECILGFDIGTRVLLIQMDTEESSQSMELIASAKYCAMNEMNLVHSPNCFVYFVTKLSRVSGGSKHIGFQGGQWLSVHIDDLMECEEMESDMSAFCSVTISELFAKESGPPAEISYRCKLILKQENPNILNTTLLLQSCVQRAVGIIRDGEDGSGRSTERVRILLDLMREDGDDEECFLRMVKQRVKVQLQEREETSLYPREWMYNEALKLDALQEGGTFRHTLWKCIQNVVAPNLAQLISVLDRDYNLSLLDDPGVSHEIKKVWLNIFSDIQILKVFKVSLISCLNELQNNGHLTQEHSPAWIHTAYRVFKKRLQSLSRTIMVYPGVLQALQHYIQETLSRDPQEMVSEIILTRYWYGIRECPICLGVPKDPALLPCKHVVCIDHLRIWLQNRKTCPKCTEPVSALKKHDTLRQKCNSFFMEVVSRFCFREDSPPSDEVITLLLSLLIAVRSCDSYQTRTLTPFSECVDASPKIRSVLLKLMLHYSFEKVKTFMQTYLSNLEEKIFDEDDLKELYILFINCFEDSMYGEFERLEGLGNLKLLRYNCSFTSRFARRQVRKYEENAAEFLQDIARLRFCFSLAAQLMGVKYEKEKRDLLEHIRMICLHCDNDWYRVYLVRTLYDQYGMDFIQSLLQREDWSWVFPDIIIKLQVKHLRDFPVQLDRFVLCGEDYQEIRDEVAKVVLNCQMHDISNKIKSLKSPASNQQVYLAMAFFREVTCAFALTDRTLHPSPKTVSLLQKFIEDSNILEASPLKTLCTALVANELGMPGSLLRVSATQPAPQRILTEIIIHAALVFTCGKMVLLAPLRNIAFHSERMRVSVCGRPIEESTCPDCGVRIGGTRHMPLQGFTLQPNRSDETQKGHILGRASKSDEIIAPDRQMTPVAFLLLRTLTHVSMMLGTISNSQVITNMIRPQVNNVSNFLYHHLENNLEQLRKLLGKNIDDTATCVHLVLDRLLNQPNGNGKRPSGWSEELGSKIERNAWEVQFIKVLISPLLKDLDKLLSDVGKRMSSDSRIGGSPIVKMLYGDPSEMLTFPHVKGLNCSSAWMCQGQISVEKFTHIVEQKDGKKRTPILWQFLQKERHIQMLSNLPDLLRLQYELIRTFQSAPDTRPKTIGQFLQQMPPGKKKSKNAQKKSHKKEFIDKDLTFQSPIEVLLPQQQGPGLCATELSKFLVGIQNDLLGAVNHPQKYSINPEEVSDAHLILCDSERDFIPLVLSNCQYTLEKGQETSSEYDILNVERQLIRQFLKGKPTITDSVIPKFVARHERDYSNIFKELKAKIPQESLPLSVCAAVTAVLKSYSDSCDALEIIEITVGFLATAGGAPDNLLLTYLKDTLYMAQRAIACVSKAFEGCRLKHTVSLWQLLSSWKSESMLGTNKDPFERIPKEYKEHLLSNEEVELRTFFANTDINTFLWELHEILVLKIGQPNLENKFRPDWSLRDILSVYLESKGSDIPPRLEDEFPEHLLLEKSIQIWKLAANFKRKNR
uniref:RING-type E3 ubiquitin transferase n=1 Tax=Callorhinchus milii TaxID=7868 RepID=A0A4W3JT85_CALMI